MRAKSIVILFISMILLATIYSVPFTNASAVNVTISGPSLVGTNQTIEYKIIVNGFFKDYGYHLFLSGENLIGALPVEEITGYSNTTNIFYTNITFPSQPQTVYIMVQGIGGTGNANVTNTAQYPVKVVYPIILTATVHNSAAITLYNIHINFYFDNVYIGNQTIYVIHPNSTAETNFSWIVSSVGSGQHTVKFVVNSTFIYFNNGQNSYQYQLYIGNAPNYSWVWYTFAVVVILIGVLLFLFSAGSRKRLPTPKWKK
jgi:cbb3-type cytochrome oxidase subunit 3